MDTSNYGAIRCHYAGRGATKLSLNYRRRNDTVEIFFETNEFASDDRSGQKDEIDECNEVSLRGCDPNLGCDKNDSGHKNDIPTPEWNTFKSKTNFEVDAKKSVWNDLNPCNKYMIYERKVKVNTINTKLSVEPLFFFGRWFLPVYVDNRKARSTMIEERIHFNRNGSFEMTHIFLKPSAYAILHQKHRSEAIQIFTSYQDEIGMEPKMRINVTSLHPYPSYLDPHPSSSGNTRSTQFGAVEVTVPSYSNCMIKLETFGRKMLDASFHHSGFIFNNVMVQGIYQYAMEKSLLHFLIPGLDYSPIMHLIEAESYE